MSDAGERVAGRGGWGRLAANLLLALAAGATLLLVAVPGLVREPRERGGSFQPPGWLPESGRRTREELPPGGYALGTDYLGRPFAAVLAGGMGRTFRVAFLGTLLVVFGCVLLGTLHGLTRSRALEAILAAGNLGVMAVPEAAVLITLAAAWPRTAPALGVNASLVAVLVLFAVPTGARLVADRVRSLGRSGFVAASRACGATPAHTFRHEVLPHLVDDLAWVGSSVLPRFVAIEVGLAYLGVEYRDFEGLGRTLSKSFNNINDRTAAVQMLATILVILWVVLLPQVALRLTGTHAREEVTP